VKRFPIMSGDERQPRGPESVPWDFMAPHERQARRNHDRSWRMLPIPEAIAAFQAHLDAWEKNECRRLNARVTELEAENARLKEQLEAETRACTQLWCDVTNAWVNYSTDGDGDVEEFAGKIRALAERNPHAPGAHSDG